MASKRKLRKGQPIGARSASGRKRDRTPRIVGPCEGIIRRRAAYGMAANDTDCIDALGRAYGAGLLGNGERAKDMLTAGRKIAWQYWRIFKPQFPTPDSLARFQPQLASSPIAPESEKILEAALNDTLDTLNRARRDIRRAFDQLVIDLNPDSGPPWLDRIIFAHRSRNVATEADLNMLRLAIEGLHMVA